MIYIPTYLVLSVLLHSIAKYFGNLIISPARVFKRVILPKVNDIAGKGGGLPLKIPKT